MQEIWKDIPGYEGLYQASNLGQIRSLDRYVNNNGGKNKINGRILKPTKNNKGYLTYSIMKKRLKGHRLVAQTFISNPNNYKEVNHKDEDKTNNRVDNLMWCSHKENSNWGTRNKRIAKTLEKPVIQYDKNGTFIKEYKSINEAIKEVNSSHIGCCCLGKRKTAGGFIWKYKEKL